MSLMRQVHELLARSHIEASRKFVYLYLNKHCGTGKDEFPSKYDNLSIVMKKQAQLENKLNFTVHINGIHFKSSRRIPNSNHGGIIRALQVLNYSISENQYKDIKHSLINLYYLQKIAILTIKWLFIEQYFTFWNWSSRATLMIILAKNGHT